MIGTLSILDSAKLPVDSGSGRFTDLPYQPVPPEVRIRPQVPRKVELVPPELKTAIRNCRLALSPWPLFIWGGVGTGKTRFALLVHDFFGGRLAEFSELVDEFRSAKCGTLRDTLRLGEPLMSEVAWLNRISAHRLLVIDEIGLRETTDHARETLSRVLNVRECLPTLLVSNLSPAEIATNFDERVASRMCVGTVVHVAGGDRRLKPPSPGAQSAAGAPAGQTVGTRRASGETLGDNP